MTPLRQGLAGQGAAENKAVFLSYASQDAEAARRVRPSSAAWARSGKTARGRR